MSKEKGLIFTRQAGEDGIEVRVADETVWLTQKLISVLFDKGRSTITEHLKNIFETGELDEKQYVGISDILPRTAKRTRRCSTIWMRSSRWCSGSTRSCTKPRTAAGASGAGSRGRAHGDQPFRNSEWLDASRRVDLCPATRPHELVRNTYKFAARGHLTMTE